MKKISTDMIKIIAFIVFCASLLATLIGLLLAAGIIRFSSDAYDDLLLSYVGIITSLIGITFVAISWFAYVLASWKQGKTKAKN